jgi:hypothetical protein
MVKLAVIQVGDQVFASEGGEEFGAVRLVSPEGRAEIVVYVENSRDYVVPVEAITAAHDGKVLLRTSALPKEMQTAIKRAHARERI